LPLQTTYSEIKSRALAHKLELLPWDKEVMVSSHKITLLQMKNDTAYNRNNGSKTLLSTPTMAGAL
jgi:hypothetical protein